MGRTRAGCERRTACRREEFERPWCLATAVECQGRKLHRQQKAHKISRFGRQICWSESDAAPPSGEGEEILDIAWVV